MSPYGTLTITYRADVFVPKDVRDAFYFTREFGEFAIRVVKDAVNAGEDVYDAPIRVWAEFYVKRDAEDFINNWHNRILLWQEQMRNEAKDYPTTYDQGGTA